MKSTEEIVDLLRRENPYSRAVDLRVFADALRTYLEAADNIRRHGAIVAHPRTGSPMENPYLRVQAQAAGVLARLKFVKSDLATAELERCEREDATQASGS